MSQKKLMTKEEYYEAYPEHKDKVLVIHTKIGEREMKIWYNPYAYYQIKNYTSENEGNEENTFDSEE